MQNQMGETKYLLTEKPDKNSHKDIFGKALDINIHVVVSR
jgi:hypothetical protein